MSKKPVRRCSLQRESSSASFRFRRTGRARAASAVERPSSPGVGTATQVLAAPTGGGGFGRLLALLAALQFRSNEASHERVLACASGQARYSSGAKGVQSGPNTGPSWSGPGSTVSTVLLSPWPSMNLTVTFMPG
jgi:hypothetical protein